MQPPAGVLTREEKAVLALRELYRSYGYRRYRIDKFEPYDLYRDNKDFLGEETAITFPDSRGRLMALKPDVTMSIVNDYRPDGRARKWHYTENVFRRGGDGEFREIRQIGIEYLGGGPLYPQAEVLLLALKSLAVFSDKFILAVGHLGLLNKALGDVPPSALLLDCVRRKNAHDLARLVGDGNAGVLSKLLDLPAELPRALAALDSALADRDAGGELEELRTLCDVVERNGLGRHLRLDFSVLHGLNYYNGMCFQGCVDGLARPVLNGGRYDGLLEKMGKPSVAVGFAVYLAELEALLRDGPQGVDVALINRCPDLAAVLDRVEEWVRQGRSVRVCRVRAEADGAASVWLVDESGALREEDR
ncbi:ATP phosphoribosyltransferase regulatory subunit [Fretibacterium sp. OH1220_COT-178]|uniref:ATP phosphoribosyltransferase regulatory subunit n=1 Tax=Fretibacterium sp. OH1220_COT-178 TaxID=2491047 RepID=UPI000F5F4ECC|nr:ATP phosphoribosyltransferase regulatory subunit [Fretibacterium sp. OH1220_COT-178]RRD63612.1 hypothetical protein EII26_10765 [Fretibacterium sp. OH1220_COT-178]